MSIIESYIKDSNPIISVAKIYKKSETVFSAFIITFSLQLINQLIEDGVVEIVSDNIIKTVSCNYPVYRFVGTNIGIIKSTIGAPITAALIQEISYIYSCNKVIVFGTCGSLDKSIPENQIIIPTAAYRGEGTSYHYSPLTDYIVMKNYAIMSKMMDELGVPYISGKTWTTDAFYHETKEEMIKRKEEGCIVVEMELSACQAVCDYEGIELYSFLCRSDNLDSDSWKKRSINHTTKSKEKINIATIAFEIAKKV